MTRGNSNKKVISLKNRRRKFKGIKIDNKIIAGGILLAIGIGVFLGFRPNAYQIIINGKMVGAVKNEQIIEAAKQTVMTQLEESYHAQIKFEDGVQTKKYHAKKRDYIAPSYLITYMRKNMNVLIAFKEIYVEGKSIGIVASDEDVKALKEALKKEYYGDKDVEVDFGKKVEVKEVFAKEEDLINKDTLFEKCTVTTPKIVEYKVGSGDSLSGIAAKLGITIENINTENVGFTNQTVLKIGQVIKARVNDPLLPLIVTKDNTVSKANKDVKQTAEGKKEE